MSMSGPGPIGPTPPRFTLRAVPVKTLLEFSPGNNAAPPFYLLRQAIPSNGPQGGVATTNDSSFKAGCQSFATRYLMNKTR